MRAANLTRLQVHQAGQGQAPAAKGR